MKGKLRPVWNTKSPTVRFINEGDFQKDDLLSRLGLADSELRGSFGATDRDEIISRQELVQLLWENPKLLERCGYVHTINPSTDLHMSDPFTFLADFNPKRASTPYLEAITKTRDAFADAMKASGRDAQGRLRDFIGHLDETLGDAAALEKRFIAAVYPELEQQARYHGLLRYRFEWGQSPEEIKPVDSEAVGWRQYSFGLSSLFRLIRYPEHRTWRFLTKAISYVFFPIAIFIYAWNYWMEKKRFEPLLQNDLPDAMKQDVTNSVQDLIRTMQVRYREDKLNEDELGKQMSGAHVNMSFAVNYGEHGLRIRLINHSVEKPRGAHENLYNNVHDFFRQHHAIGQYTGKFRRDVDRLNRELVNRLDSTLFIWDLYRLVTRLVQGSQPDILRSEGVIIHDNGSKMLFRREALSLILDVHPEIAAMHKEIVKYRTSLRPVLGNIHAVAELVSSMRRATKKVDKPICFPTILPDSDHIVEFRELYPIHLIGRVNNVGKTVTSNQLVPINQLIPINGQMVVLTGQNAGGKTATKVELVNAIYLAQSGLPVFAETFALNPKRVIGLVFVERGSGSLLQLLLKKTMNILEALKSQKENHVFVVIDELLTGTQETRGFEIGKQVLRKLSGSGASVIFSTQITRLAEFAVSDLHAVPFGFDINHRVSQGIALGNPEELMKELGMDKLLEEEKMN